MYRDTPRRAAWSRALALALALLPPFVASAVAADAAAGGVSTPGAGVAVAGRASAPAETQSAVLELLAASGVDRSLERFLVATREAGADGARRGAAGRDDARERVALITDALDRAFALERLRPIVARNVAAATEAGDVDALLAHHRSDLGRRLQTAIRTRQPSADAADYERFVAAFGTRAGDAERAAVLETYVRESGAADLVARFLVETEITSLHAALAITGERSGADFERDVAAATGAIEPLRDVLAERLPPLLAYAYEDFSVEELRAMMTVELSAAGRRVTAGVFDGFREVTVAANARFVAHVKALASLAEAQREI